MTAVRAETLAERAAELSSWCDLDPPTTRDIECSLRRDTDQLCLVGPGGDGAAVVVPRWGSAAVKYLAVPPAARGQGIGGALLAGIDQWAAANGNGVVLFGLAAPGYLWPGVELGLTSLETFLIGRRYEVAMWAVNQSVDLPIDLRVGQARLARAEDADLVAGFCRQHHPNWEPEARWSFEEAEPKCSVWLDDGELLGFACWSVTRQGWFGPMATRPDLAWGRSGLGVGTGTLSVALDGLFRDGYRSAEISWVDPERFYTRVAGARAHRAFRIFQRPVKAAKA